MLTGNKDTDKLVLERMDDKTLINTMATNPALLRIGEVVFRDRLRNNYPYLFQKKPVFENYRRYYLRMMYYIFKLKEDFNIDYVPVPSFDPEGLYRGLSLTFKTKSGKLIKHTFDRDHKKYLIPYYAELGNEDIMRRYVDDASSSSQRRQNRYILLENLIKNKNINLYEKLNAEWNLENPKMFEYAVQTKDKDIIQYFLAKFQNADSLFYYGALGAAAVGSLEMLEYMRELFPDEEEEDDDYLNIIAHAIQHGQLDFVRSFLTYENKDFLIDIIPYVIVTTKLDFIPEHKAKQILSLILDYYLEHGGTKSKFFKKLSYKEEYFYQDLDPSLVKFFKAKFNGNSVNLSMLF